MTFYLGPGCFPLASAGHLQFRRVGFKYKSVQLSYVSGFQKKYIRSEYMLRGSHFLCAIEVL
jgi:hypothetical protein